MRSAARFMALFVVAGLPAAAAENPPQIAFKQFPGDRQAIVRLDQTGGNAVEITRGRPMPSEFGAFSWSPDGSRLVYASHGLVGGDLYSLSADGADLTRLTFQNGNDHPAWSPDGTRIAYVHTDRRPLSSGLYRLDADIWLVGADGTDARRLTADAGQKFAPEWSPDGSRLRYARLAPRGGPDSFVVDAATGRVLLRTPGSDSDWSADGSQVAVENAGRIDVMSSGGAGRRTVARSGASDPDWSPDGSWIAFSRSRCVASFKGICSLVLRSIYAVGRDGRGERRLTGPISRGAGAETEGFPNDDSSDPTWWPDGSRLFFQRQGRAFVVNADGTCEQPFGPSNLLLGTPVWRPGSRPTLGPLQCADLRVRATPHRDLLARGAEARVQVVVENDGNRAATGIHLTLRLASGRGLVRPPLKSCRGTAVVDCTLGPLMPGAVTRLVVRVAELRPPGFRLQARVAARESASTTHALGTVLACDIVGTLRADRLVGTPTDDTMCGLSGSDAIAARAGDDTVKGDGGDDTIVPGPGRDVVSGSDGRDRVHARDGRRDVIDCGRGRDMVEADPRDRVGRTCERVRRRGDRLRGRGRSS